MAEPHSAPPSRTEPSYGEHEPIARVIPVPVLLGVFLALLVLTGVTVAATWIDLGDWNLLVAMGIATVKAALVALFFMHLRYDNPFYGLILCTALFFVAVFIALTLLDTREYQPDIRRYEERLSMLPAGSPHHQPLRLGPL